MPDWADTPEYNAAIARGQAKAAEKARAVNAARKAAGGLEYEEWKEKCRLSKAKTRAAWGRQPYDRRIRTTEQDTKHHLKRRSKPLGKQNQLIAKSRSRAKKAGMEHTITWDDIYWPTHCPVLGIELNYGGKANGSMSSAASLDRWDNTRGYLPGNVYVISYRANALKNNGTADELEKVAEYARYGTY